MGITGILVLRIEEGFTATDDIIIEKMRFSREVVETYCGHPHRHYACIEEPEYIYQIGGWDSVEQHFRGLHSDESVGDLLAEMAGFMSIEASYHLDVELDQLPLDRPMPVIGINRFWIEKKNHDTFVQGYKYNITQLKTLLEDEDFVGAWRIIDDAGWSIELRDATGELNGLEEYNLISCWPNVQRHQQFVKQGNQKFQSIFQYVVKLTVHHMLAMDT